MQLIEQLKTSLLFSGLDDQDLASLAAIAVRRPFVKGEALFTEGEEANGFYLLVEGHLKLCRVSPDGREKVCILYAPLRPLPRPLFSEMVNIRRMPVPWSLAKPCFCPARDSWSL